MALSKTEVKELMHKYKQRIEEELEIKRAVEHEIISVEYNEFKKSYIPKTLTYYEKLCNFSQKIIKPKLKPENKKKIQDALKTSHIDTEPEATQSFAYIIPIFIIIIGALISAILSSIFLLFSFLIAGVLIIPYLQKLPEQIANSWRMRASNQMIMSVFYIVTYMRHTSNLERAIEFASQHLAPPLALDFKKILWDVETGTYETITQALDNYLETWRMTNKEFIQSFNLIESSLYEGDEKRRIELLDKSLEIILDETYEKMLHYAQDLKGPITTLHMLGVMLPILGLLVLPLIISMSEAKWWQLAIIYNVALPIIVYLMGKKILSQRPTGYGNTDITEINPAFKEYESNTTNLGIIKLKPKILCFLIGIILLTLGLSPIIIHTINPSFEFSIIEGIKLLDYRKHSTTGEALGPYGFLSSIISFLIPLSLAFSIGLYYRLITEKTTKIKEKTKQMEQEFSSALYQLGNRLEDGVPLEIALDKVSQIMRETTTGQFFNIITTNIKKMGYGMNEAIFGKQYGAIKYFPSNIIHSSMKILVESIKKGPRIAAQAMVNVSKYIREIHKVDERLKDLLAEIISDMKSQITLMAPVFAAILIGITTMFTQMITALVDNTEKLKATEFFGRLDGMMGLFENGMPVYYFQIIVGIYIFQIIYILTVMLNGIENGTDKLKERELLGKNLINATIKYTLVSLATMTTFTIMMMQVMSKMNLN